MIPEKRRSTSSKRFPDLKEEKVALPKSAAATLIKKERREAARASDGKKRVGASPYTGVATG